VYTPPPPAPVCCLQHFPSPRKRPASVSGFLTHRGIGRARMREEFLFLWIDVDALHVQGSSTVYKRRE